ncbi:hypothetical protein B0H13DRAFT_2672299 [Mycena leptocephala]|nr:hypothetical protein B0H13DRAFT_2672299 [Mycena leptocephala]
MSSHLACPSLSPSSVACPRTSLALEHSSPSSPWSIPPVSSLSSMARHRLAHGPHAWARLVSRCRKSRSRQPPAASPPQPPLDDASVELPDTVADENKSKDDSRQARYLRDGSTSPPTDRRGSGELSRTRPPPRQPVAPLSLGRSLPRRRASLSLPPFTRPAPPPTSPFLSTPSLIELYDKHAKSGRRDRVRYLRSGPPPPTPHPLDRSLPRHHASFSPLVRLGIPAHPTSRLTPLSVDIATCRRREPNNGWADCADRLTQARRAKPHQAPPPDCPSPRCPRTTGPGFGHDAKIKRRGRLGTPSSVARRGRVVVLISVRPSRRPLLDVDNRSHARMAPHAHRQLDTPPRALGHPTPARHRRPQAPTPTKHTRPQGTDAHKRRLTQSKPPLLPSASPVFRPGARLLPSVSDIQSSRPRRPFSFYADKAQTTDADKAQTTDADKAAHTRPSSRCIPRLPSRLSCPPSPSPSYSAFTAPDAHPHPTPAWQPVAVLGVANVPSITPFSSIIM